MIHKHWQDIYKAVTKEFMPDSMNFTEVYNRNDMSVGKLNKEKEGKAL